MDYEPEPEPEHGEGVINDEPEEGVINDEPEEGVINDEPEEGVINDEPEYDEYDEGVINDEPERMARLWPMWRSLTLGPKSMLLPIDLIRFGGGCMGLVLAFRCETETKMFLDSDASFHPFETCELRLNGNIYASDNADRMRFWNWQRQGLKPPKHEKWYLLPFSPHMFAAMPHTTINFSRIDNVQLRLKMRPEAAHWYVEVAAPSFGFYVVNQDGMLSFPCMML